MCANEFRHDPGGCFGTKGAKMTIRQTYAPKDFHLLGLTGISDRTLDMHYALYKGYVKHTNLLSEQLAEMIHKKQALSANPAYSELKRHLGFEYGGMILHEYYFLALAPKGAGEPSKELRRAINECFGSFPEWMADFTSVGNMRGVGWAVLYQDPVTGGLSNHWIALHDQGVPPSFKPLLVMDMWEHAYMLDYSPSNKQVYIESFQSNINWNAVNHWLANLAADRLAA